MNFLLPKKYRRGASIVFAVICYRKETQKLHLLFIRFITTTLIDLPLLYYSQKLQKQLKFSEIGTDILA